MFRFQPFEIVDLVPEVITLRTFRDLVLLGWWRQCWEVVISVAATHICVWDPGEMYALAVLNDRPA